MLGHEGRQAKQAETGDKYGQAGKEGEQLAEALVCLVLVAKGLIEKMIHERALRRQLVPGCFEVRDGAGDIVAFDRDGDAIEHIWVAVSQGQGFHFLVERPEVEIFYHSDKGSLSSPLVELFAYGVGRVIVSKKSRRRFIDDQGLGAVGLEGTGIVPTRDKGDVEGGDEVKVDLIDKRTSARPFFRRGSGFAYPHWVEILRARRGRPLRIRRRVAGQWRS